MTIAETIAKITDRSLFEKIVVDSLRVLRPELATIIHNGINAKGETVISPLDAFQRLASGDFALVEVTTDDTGLRNKWLNAQNGDLIKASKKAQEWREQFPHSSFIVWMCTNQRVSETLNNQLFTDVQTKAQELQLKVEFLEQSALSAFLENNPTGEWIAQNYLGIRARRLSFELLKELSQESLKHYKREIYYNEQRVIERCQLDSLTGRIHETQLPILLVGKSGAGKSTLSSMLLENWLKAGKFGIRISPETARISNSANAAVERQLKTYYNDLYIDEDFFSNNIEGKHIIVIDDINKSTNPGDLLEHILNWQSDPRFCIIVPIWQNVYTQLPYAMQRDAKQNFSKVFLDVYSKEEAFHVLSKALTGSINGFTTEQINRIASDLSFDPFLIDTYCDLEGLNPENCYSLTQNPIDTYLDEKIKSISVKHTVSIYQLKDALLSLADIMLRRKQLQLSLSAFDNPSQPSLVTLLDKIGAEQYIFSIDDRGAINFKHDKIRDHLLSKQITLLLENPNKNKAILAEPFYAELIGKALGKLSLESYRSKISWFLNHLPLAVIESLNYVQNEELSKIIADSFISWKSAYSPIFADAILESMEISLATIQNPNVITIAKGFPHSLPNLIARFRNGETIAGVMYVASFVTEDFEPSFGHLERDRLFENFKIKYKESGIKETVSLLGKTQFDGRQKEAIILFAGYIAETSLYERIYTLWESDKERLLLPSIWGMICCFNKDKAGLLQNLFDYWHTLPEEESSSGYPEGTKALTSYHIGRSHNTQWPNDLVSLLLLNAQNEDYRDLVWPMLVTIDHPDVLKFVVKRLALVDNALKKKKPGGFYLASITLAKFPEKWSKDIPGGKKMSTTGKSSLQKIWEDPEGNEPERYQAFRLWAATADSQDLHLLRGVSNQDSRIYTAALKTRLGLTDYTVLTEIKLLIKDDNDESATWLSHLCFIWNPEVAEYVRSLIREHKHKVKHDFESHAKSHLIYALSELLAYIPAEEASQILSEFWEYLQYESNFLILAMLCGTSECRKLLDESMAKVPDQKAVFRFLRVKISDGKIVNQVHFKKETIRDGALESMKPYLLLFEQNVIEEIARRLDPLQLESFGKKFLKPLMKSELNGFSYKRDLFPSGGDLEREFTGYVNDKNRRWQLEHWLQRLSKRNIDKGEIIMLIKRVIKKSPTNPNVIDSCASCLEQIGDRLDLKILGRLEKDDAMSHFYHNTRYKVFRRVLS